MKCAEMNNRAKCMVTVTPRVKFRAECYRVLKQKWRWRLAGCLLESEEVQMRSGPPPETLRQSFSPTAIPRNSCRGFENERLVFCSALSQALLGSAQAETVDKKYTLTDLFRTPNIRKIAVCSGIVW